MSASQVFVNPTWDPAAVSQPTDAARSFHRSLEGFHETALVDLPELAKELGVRSLQVKDESDRVGLPAFKILGASWAAEQVLREHPQASTLVTASAGNHGRAVARVAAMRGLCCRVFLPERSVAARREAIAAEGAEVVIVDGSYEEAVAAASADVSSNPDAVEIADVGDSLAARSVIDGYATLFAEIGEQADALDVLLVPVGVGSLAAAACRFGPAQDVTVVGVESERAACLTDSLRAGEPTVIETPGTVMAGMDCAEVSLAAWPHLRAGIRATVTVPDGAIADGAAALSRAGIEAGECGAASAAALQGLPGGWPALADAIGVHSDAAVVLLSTEGRTGG